ncbi:hypothetical protein HK101_003238, partial [Irineochytrium annulatum]
MMDLDPTQLPSINAQLNAYRHTSVFHDGPFSSRRRDDRDGDCNDAMEIFDLLDPEPDPEAEREENGGDGEDEEEPRALGRLRAVVVVDTNYLISHLGFLSDLVPIMPESTTMMIPAVVVRELDGLKKSEKRGKEAVGRAEDALVGDAATLGDLAKKANDFIYNCLVKSVPTFRGQKAADILLTEDRGSMDSDDRILECCRFAQINLSPNVILLSNDKNLCVKALVNSAKTVSYYKGNARDFVDEYLGPEVLPAFAFGERDEDAECAGSEHERHAGYGGSLDGASYQYLEADERGERLGEFVASSYQYNEGMGAAPEQYEYPPKYARYKGDSAEADAYRERAESAAPEDDTGCAGHAAYETDGVGALKAVEGYGKYSGATDGYHGYEGQPDYADYGGGAHHEPSPSYVPLKSRKSRRTKVLGERYNEDIHEPPLSNEEHPADAEYAEYAARQADIIGTSGGRDGYRQYEGYEGYDDHKHGSSSSSTYQPSSSRKRRSGRRKSLDEPYDVEMYGHQGTRVEKLAASFTQNLRANGTEAGGMDMDVDMDEDAKPPMMGWDSGHASSSAGAYHHARPSFGEPARHAGAYGLSGVRVRKKTWDDVAPTALREVAGRRKSEDRYRRKSADAGVLSGVPNWAEESARAGRTLAPEKARGFSEAPLMHNRDMRVQQPAAVGTNMEVDEDLLAPLPVAAGVMPRSASAPVLECVTERVTGGPPTVTRRVDEQFKWDSLKNPGSKDRGGPERSPATASNPPIRTPTFIDPIPAITSEIIAMFVPSLLPSLRALLEPHGLTFPAYPPNCSLTPEEFLLDELIRNWNRNYAGLGWDAGYLNS